MRYVRASDVFRQIHGVRQDRDVSAAGRPASIAASCLRLATVVALTDLANCNDGLFGDSDGACELTNLPVSCF